jgi:cell fate (sporulation/competence/biofilm development) regulator YlbF (YheA/YmcA/DUF963 family)
MFSMQSSFCFVLAFYLVAHVGGCGASGPRPVQVAQAPAQDAPVNPDGPAVPSERKIIYQSQIDVVVDDLLAAQQRLQVLIKGVQESGGYLARQEVTGRTGEHRQGSWTIRVPISRFDGFVAEVESLGELLRNSREAQDVTEAYADLEARLRNKQASEQRLLSHLAKTGDLKDTLECERELSRVRGEVEQLQGQFNLMKNKTDLATVVVNLHERANYKPPTAPAFSTMVNRTFADSWGALMKFGQVLVLLAVALAPWLVAAAAVLVPVGIVYRYSMASRKR